MFKYWITNIVVIKSILFCFEQAVEMSSCQELFTAFYFLSVPQIVAIVIEGRNDSGSRRRGYRKLETNVEEAMPSMNKANSTYVY